MDILVLGGTRFVGRHIVEAALARGHRLTLFHRGKSGDDLFPEVERILGDRDGGLAALGERRWDAVFDTCGYHPRVVRQSVERLTGRAEAYLFISTVSVYADGNPRDKPISEDGKLIRFDAMPESEEITNETYGGFKVLCEEAVAEFSGRITVVRPGLVIGPHDTSDRFTYWVDRFLRKGPVLVPSPLTGKIQLVDARDLAAFCVHLLENQIEGIFNADAPAEAITYQEMLHVTQMNTDGDAEPVTVSEAWLEEQGVRPWADLPLWIPDGEDAMHEYGISRALANGFEPRSLASSVRDIAVWHAARMPVELKTGLSRERELELVEIASTVEG